MTKSRTHLRTQLDAAGPQGMIEVPLPSGRILDALTGGMGRATEIELSGSYGRLFEAALRLNESSATQHILRVPHRHGEIAAQAMWGSGPNRVKIYSNALDARQQCVLQDNFNIKSVCLGYVLDTEQGQGGGRVRQKGHGVYGWAGNQNYVFLPKKP